MARPRLIALALALLTLLVYLPVRRHAFIVYDDPDYITENPVVQRGLTAAGVEWAFTTWHANNWHPLTWLSHMLDVELFGLDAGAHHLVNVLLHAINAVLAFLVLRRMTGRLWPSAVVTALFAWHPLHIQSVAWASERKDVLSTLLFWLTLWAYTAYVQRLKERTESKRARLRPGSARQLWFALLFFALGLMSKPMLVTLPFVLLLLDYWPLRRFEFILGQTTPANLVSLVREKLPFFALSAASCVVTYLAQRAEAVIALEPHPLHLRIANALVAYTTYLLKMLWPADLAIVYPLRHQWPWWWLTASTVFLAGLSLVIGKARRTRPHLVVGWLWYVGMLVPVIGLIQVGGQAMADRYTYLPLVGIFLAVIFEAAAAIDRLRLRPGMPAVVTGVLLGACILGTTSQLRYWRNSEALFTRALAITRDNAIAHANLGIGLQQENRREEAMQQYREALRVDPNLVQAHNNLANLLDDTGHSNEAVQHYREAVRLKPGAALAHANLAALLSRLGRQDEALREFTEAVQLSQNDPRPYYLWAKALLRAGRGLDAVARFRSALQLAPDDVRNLTWLARVLAAHPDPTVRNPSEGARLAERANSLTGGLEPFVLDTLAIAYAANARFSEARQVLEKGLQVSPPGSEEASQLGARLKLFESGKPYLEDFTASTTGKP